MSAELYNYTGHLELGYEETSEKIHLQKPFYLDTVGYNSLFVSTFYKFDSVALLVLCMVVSVVIVFPGYNILIDFLLLKLI